MIDEEDSIFNSDVLYMKSLVGKKVKVQTENNEFHFGIIYVIDPVYKTVILHLEDNSKEEEFKMIPHHSIKSFEVISEKADVSYLADVKENEDECRKRKKSLLELFNRMFIKVEESENKLKIEDDLVILPPYRSENCISSNAIILERIKKIIDEIKV